jgi:NADPH2:quinone reductase
MKAIVVREFGGPEVLRLEEAPLPVAGPGQVVVEVRAAGVNPANVYMRSGNYAVKPPLPYTPGTDGAGVVASVGAGGTRVKAGDRVYLARSVSGTYAQFALALETQAEPLPARLSFAQGSAIYVPFFTAWHALRHHARARAGEALLVHGASGGVGVAATQIARAMGMRVFGSAGTAKGLELVKSQGAVAAFDHTASGYRDEILRATAGRGFDVILEMLANVNLAHDMKLIATNGRIVVIGSRGDVTVTPRDLMTRRGAIHAFTLWAISEAEAAESAAAIGAGLEDGTLHPVVDREFPLADAARAHEDVMAAGALGKIVLLP